MTSVATLPGSALCACVIRESPDSVMEAKWRRFLGSQSWAVQFSGPEFFLDPRVRRRNPFAILITRGDDVVGCLTALQNGSAIVSGLETHPQMLVTEGPDAREVERAIAQALLQEKKDRGYIAVYSWKPVQGFDDLNFWTRQCNQTCVLDLTQDEQTLLRNVHDRKQRCIKNAAKREIILREAVDADFLGFYEVLKGTHQRLRLPAPLPIDEILMPATNRKLIVAIHKNQCVGGTIIRYQAGGMAEASENGSVPEYWRLQTNVLLYWETILSAKKMGCTSYNFGGHIAMKRQFGSLVYPVYKVSYDDSLLRWQHSKEWLLTAARRTYSKFRPYFGVLRRKTAEAPPGPD